MIPFNILFLIGVFVVFYAIGALLSAVSLIDSIRNRKVTTAIIAVMLLAVYIVFGLGLI